ncbi:SPOR domain-containing protein [Synergistaceae bacterium OttesenSCG-928-I11]|nr:SPOR domain-containing protein [Synergistaceae bacterium OttesenSCG-928-I11]
MGSTTRKTRNYKEKNSMLAFGHIALPLAAVIAVGLLFIGIKLFFLSPSETGVVEVTSETPVTVVETTQPDTTESAQQTADATSMVAGDGNVAPSQETRETAVTLAGPITQGSSTETSSASGASSAAQSSAPSRPGATTGTSSGSAPQVASRPSVQTGALTSKYGVQIGAFTRQEGANSVVEEVTKQGYVAAVSSAESSGKTYHRVRVAAGDTKEEAERLAAELKQKGYPVLVVANP